MKRLDLDPNDLLLFARVAEMGSFSRAAERLGVPKSTLSRRVSALEARLGERLLLRTTRKLSVTDFGQSVLEHARHVAEDVEAAASLAQNRQVAPSGTLRVTMPADFGTLLLAPVLARFARKHRAIRVEIDLSSRFVDLVGEGFDVAIRMGALRDDASLSAHKLTTLTSALFAAPSYVKQRGLPANPQDLAEHDGLVVTSRSGDPLPWTLYRRQERWHGVVPVRVTANSPDLLMRLALDGAGIAAVTQTFALEHVRRKALVRVLPQWSLPPVDAWAVFPGRRLMPAKTRTFIDTLAAFFARG